MRKLSEYLMSRDLTRCIGRAAIVATAMFSINAMAEYVPIATGGEKKVISHSLSQDGSKITMVVTHTFTNAAEVESLVFNKAATVDVLVVGGGGGGGGSGGGGGAGGLVYRQGVAMSAGAYEVMVGAGGAGGKYRTGSNAVTFEETDGKQGGNSSITNSATSSEAFLALGGGSGGGWCRSGGTGGSGGGGGTKNGGNGGSGNGGNGTSGQGNAGGNAGRTAKAGGTGSHDANARGGGGGGAGGVGTPGFDANWSEDESYVDVRGLGGDGLAVDISGESVVYAAGGSGAHCTAANGPGGAGAAKGMTGSKALDGTGSGGGAGGTNGSNINYSMGGGAGGSGIVIVRYTETIHNGFDSNAGDSYRKVDGDFVHSYTETGVTNYFTVSTPCYVELLVVAGGGSGGTAGGGGGAGGVISTNVFLIPGTYPVYVGAGGAGGSSPANGKDSFFDDFVAIGGGKGANCRSTAAGATGGSGGGGGSGTKYNGDNYPCAGGSGTPEQGYAGGRGSESTGLATPGGSTYAGGGGGAGGPGGDGDSAMTVDGVDYYGIGGAGVTNSITGAEVVYAAGGSGSRCTTPRDGIGGAGGGVATSSNKPAGGDGAAGTGSGGGGGSIGSSNFNYKGYGGAGGSGIVVVRHHGAKSAGLILFVR